MSTTMFCGNTQLAVIYADHPESSSKSDPRILIKDIRALEKAIWNYSGQKYLGIFTLNEGKVAPHFAEFAAFHASTETGCILGEPGIFGATLQERLRSNGTTQLLFVGFEVAAAALEAKKQGFQVCIFQPATRAKASLPLEEMKAAGVVLAESTEQVIAFFDRKLSISFAYQHCIYCHWESGIPRWCIHQMGDFLWYTLMRVRMALNAVIDSGFDGPVDPLTYSKDWAVKERPKGYWRCTYEEKHELLKAIDLAGLAGIYTGDAIHMASFTPPFREHREGCELEALKEEVAMLKAQLAAAEAKTKSPSFYVSDK